MVSEVFFFIESKLFQLVVEEGGGGNFFSLKIFEWGKYYMQLVLMGKSAALWLIFSPLRFSNGENTTCN